MSEHTVIMDKVLQVGDLFDQYQIQSHLAQGGMSDIYRAYDLVRRREVAIKIPNQLMIGDPAQYERFQRELEVINTLQHPAVLSGLGSGKYNRVPYLVTEFIDGQSLRTLIDEQSPLLPAQAVDLIRKIADGMAYCHANGVVHRDLKPENILITTDGQPIIMDFGLALTKSAHRVTYSNLSATVGTPDYIAPEQIEGQRGDQRTDIYALGTILFEMLAGRLPFQGDHNLAVMNLHLNGTAPRLDRLNPSISPQLASIAARCLERDPANRYPDMKALIDALEHPETVDLSILNRINDTAAGHRPIFQSIWIKAVGFSALVMVVIVVLALALQALR